VEIFESLHFDQWVKSYKEVFICRQLWIFYSKINSEVLYFTQFSIFLEKNKISRYILFTKTLQPLGLAFFNSINKLVKIWCFESFSTSFYSLFFSYMLYNSKWSENFQACNELDLKNEFKELPPFRTFFHTNVGLQSAIAQFFARPRKEFLWIQKLMSCNPISGNFWNIFHVFSN